MAGEPLVHGPGPRGWSRWGDGGDLGVPRRPCSERGAFFPLPHPRQPWDLTRRGASDDSGCRPLPARDKRAHTPQCRAPELAPPRALFKARAYGDAKAFCSVQPLGRGHSPLCTLEQAGAGFPQSCTLKDTRAKGKRQG